jgi:hypothetical protein
MQRYLFQTIKTYGKPVTFADLRTIILKAENAPSSQRWLPQSVERSLRRALHRMVSDGVLIAIGGGGRGDPYRYFIDPILVAMISAASGDPAEWCAYQQAIEAHPGATEAANKAAAKMFRQEKPG